MQMLSGESRHKCLIYDGDPIEQLPVVVPLLIDGLRDQWRCLYLGAPETVELVHHALEERGIDTAGEIARRALVLSSDRSHLEADGTFDPIAMVDGLCAAIDDAVDDGFGGLCATGDMRWELGDDRNFEHLLEYEARLERVFRDKPLRGICQYRRDIVPARAIRDALVSHGTAYIGRTLNRDNLFYIPPELLLEGANNPSAAQGEWMCQQIIRVLDAERKRDAALRAVEEVNRELERRIVERTSELEVANRQLEAFAYSVSHDLRAPLRAITGFCDVVTTDLADRLGAEGRGYFDRIVKNAHRMSNLIDAMLRLARVTSAQLDRREIALDRLGREIVDEISAAQPDRTVDIVIHDGLRASGDPTLVRAVLTNLLSNAWKFTSKRPEARIELGARTTEDANGRVFFVRDNGAGFDMQYAQELFGVSRRLHDEAEFPGHGIGLATVERIVARHGGRVWADARVGEGATFYFTLPDA